MRRKKQALPEPDCLAILGRGTAGVLALLGDGVYPYAVPISYVRAGALTGSFPNSVCRSRPLRT